jgi:hypothetical protein
MPFEILTATEDGEPLVPVEWETALSVWPGQPAHWKRSKPGLLNFLETMRVSVVVSSMRHGMFSDDLLSPTWHRRSGSQMVLCADMHLTFPRQDRIEARGFFAVPFNCMELAQSMEQVFLDNNFGEEWAENEEVTEGVRAVVCRHLPVVRGAPVLAPYGFLSSQVFPAVFISVATRAPNLPALMVDLAQRAQIFEASAEQEVAQVHDSLANTIRSDLRHWAEENGPEE